MRQFALCFPVVLPLIGGCMGADLPADVGQTPTASGACVEDGVGAPTLGGLSAISFGAGGASLPDLTLCEVGQTDWFFFHPLESGDLDLQLFGNGCGGDLDLIVYPHFPPPPMGAPLLVSATPGEVNEGGQFPVSAGVGFYLQVTLAGPPPGDCPEPAFDYALELQLGAGCAPVETCGNDLDDDCNGLPDDGCEGCGPELCNGHDDDCDGEVDEDALDATTYWLDGDGDGYGSGPPVASCDPLSGWALMDGDCWEGNPSVNPGVDELCGNNVDDNCAAGTDEGCEDPPPPCDPVETCGNGLDDDCNGLPDDGCEFGCASLGDGGPSADTAADLPPSGALRSLCVEEAPPAGGYHPQAAWYLVELEEGDTLDLRLQSLEPAEGDFDLYLFDAPYELPWDQLPAYAVGASALTGDFDDVSHYAEVPGPLWIAVALRSADGAAASAQYALIWDLIPAGCAPSETCGNGYDDDCNGQIDDGCPGTCADDAIGSATPGGAPLPWPTFLSSLQLCAAGSDPLLGLPVAGSVDWFTVVLDQPGPLEVIAQVPSGHPAVALRLFADGAEHDWAGGATATGSSFLDFTVLSAPSLSAGVWHLAAHLPTDSGAPGVSYALQVSAGCGAAEVCGNGWDDDCDGLVDNGCGGGGPACVEDDLAGAEPLAGPQLDSGTYALAQCEPPLGAPGELDTGVADWVSVWADAGATVTATVTWDPADGELLVGLFDNGVDWPWSSSLHALDGPSGGVGVAEVSLEVPTSGRWYVGVFTEVRAGPQGLPYELTLDVSGSCADDPLGRPDAASAVGLLPGPYPDLTLCPAPRPPVAGEAGYPFAGDWFAISVAAGDVVDLAIDFDAAAADLDLYLFEVQPGADTPLSAAATSSTGSTGAELLTHQARFDGLLYAVVQRWVPAPAPADLPPAAYDLWLAVTPGEPPVCDPVETCGNGLDDDCNGLPDDGCGPACEDGLGGASPGAASALATGGGGYTAQLCPTAGLPAGALDPAVDWYAIPLQAGDPLTVAAIGTSGENVDLYLFEGAPAVAQWPAAAPIATASSTRPGEEVDGLVVRAVRDGTWYVAVVRVAGGTSPASLTYELYWSPSTPPGCEAAETCGDGLDNDCDGGVDEGCGACAAGDTDSDGLCDDEDRCPTVWDPSDADTDADGYGDACVAVTATVAEGAALGWGAIVRDSALVGPTAVVGALAVIGEEATVARAARVGDGVRVGAGAIVAPRAEIGDEALIGAGAVIGRRTLVGADARIGEGVMVARAVEIGASVALGEGAIVGYAAEVGAGVRAGPRLLLGNLARLLAGQVGADLRVGRGATLVGEVVIGDRVQIGPDVSAEGALVVGSDVVVRRGAWLGALVRLGQLVRVGRDAVIEQGAQLFTGAVVEADARVSEDAIVPEGETVPRGSTWP